MFLVLQNLSSFDRHTPIDDSGGRHVLKFKLRYYIYIFRVSIITNYEYQYERKRLTATAFKDPLTVATTQSRLFNETGANTV